jgi:hypothetical protein
MGKGAPGATCHMLCLLEIAWRPPCRLENRRLEPGTLPLDRIRPPGRRLRLSSHGRQSSDLPHP